MALKELGIKHKKIDEIFVAYNNFRGEISDIPTQMDALYQNIRAYTTGSGIAVIDYGVYSDGKDIDVCFPIKESTKIQGINTKYLKNIEVLSLIHLGEDNKLGQSFQILSNYTQEHVILGTAWLRLVYHRYNQKSPKDHIEIQYNLHKWDDRIEKSIDKILGEETRKEIMKDRERYFTIESSYDDRIQWLREMLNRLDKLTNDDQRYEIISQCAHEFSPKRIEYMKQIYEKSGDIDDVIKEMYKDNAWYEKPFREGNVIYVTKVPVNQEGYDKAETLEEKKRNYCHCRFINENLDKGISTTFCNCGTGWYRQQWEGILGKPVKVKILKSILKGDNTCKVAIFIPQEFIKN